MLCTKAFNHFSERETPPKKRVDFGDYYFYEITKQLLLLTLEATHKNESLLIKYWPQWSKCTTTTLNNQTVKVTIFSFFYEKLLVIHLSILSTIACPQWCKSTTLYLHIFLSISQFTATLPTKKDLQTYKRSLG